MRKENTGENNTLEKRLQSANWKMLVKMEYTAANTPQQNALVEVKFIYLAAKARAAMHAALQGLGTGGWYFFLRWLWPWPNWTGKSWSQSTKSKRLGLSIMVYPYPILPNTYVPGEKQESSKPEKMVNWGHRNHGYVRGLRLKSQGGLLQNVESKYKAGFQDTWHGVSQLDVLQNTYDAST